MNYHGEFAYVDADEKLLHKTKLQYTVRNEHIDVVKEVTISSELRAEGHTDTEMATNGSSNDKVCLDFGLEDLNCITIFANYETRALYFRASME